MATVSGTFACFFDAAKSTSGQRFFAALADALRPQSAATLAQADTVLFNVSAPLPELIKARLRGQIVVLRLDGIYHDRLSPAFIASFRSAALRLLLRTALRLGLLVAPLSRFANLINRNYGAVARAVLAHRIVYQSEFCRRSWARYLRHKPATIIVNGFHWCAEAEGEARAAAPPADRIELVTTYDDWKPAKRIDELVAFVHWANAAGGAALRLTLLGFSGAFPSTYSSTTREQIRESPYVRNTPRFNSLDSAVSEVFRSSHAYITFSYRDPCPNVVVEAMSFGLPVVATRSGGLPDIVGNAGELIALADDADAEFCVSRYESDFPRIDYQAVLAAVRTVAANQSEYRRRVRLRFATELDIGLVAGRYAEVLRT
jgi:glycosyltransferase involved in cell wall biosynthesis